MQHQLDNPVYNSLTLLDQHLGSGTVIAKVFDHQVSPFAGIKDDHESGFEELMLLVPSDRVILFVTPRQMQSPKGWKLLDKVEGLQMVFHPKLVELQEKNNIKALFIKDVEQMLALASLTKPGPFGPRTIEFGHYYGIFDGEKLVAMTGQRLHLPDFTEISAVCTHPEYLGKGYATSLIKHQTRVILSQNRIPFLHVREDNKRAIEIYLRLGFQIRSKMNFYVLKKLT